MTRKFNLLGLAFLVAFLLAPGTSEAQVDPTDENVIKPSQAERHSKWEKGTEQFPGRPRDMWQLGIGAGSFLISGDVKPQFGWGASLHARKSLGYVLSLRGEYLFAQGRGLNYQATSNLGHPAVFPFQESAPGAGDDLYSTADPFYANYRIDQYHSLGLQAMFNLNNIKFHKKANKWALNLIVGLGANMYRTRYNALDANGNSYAADFQAILAQNNDLTTISGRNAVRDAINGVLDDSYETIAQQNDKNLAFQIGNEGEELVVNPYVSVGMGVEFLISKRISLALEHVSYISSDDLLDGKTLGESGDFTSNIDIPHYTSVRLGFHLGNKSKRVQPLWFVNPLIYPMQDVADIKEDLGEDLFADTDGDGVIDKLDEEPNTPADTRVDTRGRALDSDGDGIPDSQDKEPFSPPGYETNEEGVADIPQPISEQDVTQIGDERYMKKGDVIGGAGKDWWLPMIHFDLDKYNLRPDAHEPLLHIATIMKQYPDIKVVARGFTDTRASNDYNFELSYNRAKTAAEYLVERYGIDRSRILVQYDGENKELIESARRESQHFMNRRVEFYIAEEGDKEMSAPE